MSITGALKYLGLISVYFALGGCVAGQSLSLDYIAEQAGARNSGTVGVDVKDNRPYVVSGNKKPSYVGHYRAGFGNTWDVKTDGDEAFAAKVARDLSAELGALGFNVPKGAQAPRTVAVSIVEWNFDSYTNATVWYEFQISVLDGTGTVLSKTTVKDKTDIQGSAMTGAKSAVEREMPKIYRSAIRKLVRENPAALKALEK